MAAKHLDQHLRESAIRHASGLAYHFMGETATYDELDQTVERMARAFRAWGLRRGDKLALLLPNSGAFIVLYHGALRAGMTVIPLNPLYTPDELQYILTDSRPAVIAAPTQAAHLAGAVSALLPGVRVVGVGVRPDTLPQEVTMYEELLAGADIDGHDEWDERSVEDVAVILYTSGTTGKPKGAMLTHRNLSSNARSCVGYMGFSHNDKVIMALPMFHVFCLTVCLNASICAGTQMLVQSRFSPVETLRQIEEERATFLAGVPTMYNFILQAAADREIDMSSLRICVSGGAAMPEALLRQFEQRFGVAILEGYGLSEASPVTSFQPPDGRPRKVGSIGVSFPGVEQKIVDGQDREVAPGEIGELVVRGENVMAGYLNQPAETACALRGGWLHTGDMARVDEDGYFYIVDRKKDMILVGGYNVYPREVEEVLFRHPAVVEAAVIGVPDEQYGETVVAWVVCRSQDVTGDQIRAFCAEHLARYKCPSQVRFSDDLPKNATGKVLRRVLREQMKG